LNENNFILGDGKGLLISYNKKLKTQDWKFRNGGEISEITFTRKGLIVTSFDNYIYLISETNGRLLWKKRLSGRLLDKPQVFGNHVIVAANGDSTAAVLELDGGKLVNRVILEKDNYFLGDSMRTGNSIVYATFKGILSFSGSDGGGCLTK
jgi:outer membrane protein assembly factor BamB